VGRIDQDWKAFNAGGLKWQGHFAHELNHERDARATFAAEGNDFEDVSHFLFVDSTLWTGRAEYIMSNRAGTFINDT
jgi:hypothetical protein